MGNSVTAPSIGWAGAVMCVRQIDPILFVTILPTGRRDGPTNDSLLLTAFLVTCVTYPFIGIKRLKLSNLRVIRSNSDYFRSQF